MCVIINRDANVEIEFEKLKSACAVNPDGYGLMFADGGNMTIIRECPDKGNNPDEIARLLENYRSIPVSLHLRYTTVGKTTVDNCHPYITCMRDTDGLDVAFMHNGTLGDFRRDKSDMSDSYHFNEEIVRPLFQRFAKFSSPAEVLNDPLFENILEKYCGSSSVFNLMDGAGNILVINKDRGVQYEGWWASNSYSFNRYHREPEKTTKSNSGWYFNGRYYSRDYAYSDWQDDEPDVTKETKPNTVVVIDKPTNVIKEVTDIPQETPRKSFIEYAGLGSLEECCRLSDEDIEEMIETYPEFAKVLIQDLLYELYNRVSEEVSTNSIAKKA